MSINRVFNTGRGLRVAVVLGALAIALVVSPAAMARVHVGFTVNIALPPGVHVSVGNYEPYYLGRVFYQPLDVWRPVYSFPVETPYGVVYEPYVYDNGRVICSDYIPGPESGYGEFIIEGRGHYDPQWYRGRSFFGYDGHDRWRGRASHAPYRGWNQRQAYRGNGDWQRDRSWNRSGHHGSGNSDRGRNGHARGGPGGHHGKSRRHE
ncbi:MAG: hypothetical protein LAO51_12725 [Acidobacteriia bacterium]|nr:hypothetical protein [Terriglobia bacterium]